MSDFKVQTLLTTQTVRVADAVCGGGSEHRAGEEWTAATHLGFPYRGAYVHRCGGDEAVAEPNQVIAYNAREEFTVAHPIAGGDATLLLMIAPEVLRELPPPGILREGGELTFAQPRMRIDPRTQALVAMLRYSLLEGLAEPLEAEGLALTLAQRALGPRTAHASGGGYAHERLAHRVKLVLTSDLARRWTLAEIAAEVGGSPVYLTQVFRQVEGVPLYRYQLRLRLARSLDLLPDYEDLTALSLELGFSSHSHFTSAFRQAYGRSPAEFREAVLTGARSR